MKRRIAIILLLLAGGAIVNVAVAWGLAWYLDSGRHIPFEGSNVDCDKSGYWYTEVDYFPGGVLILSVRGPEPEFGCEPEFSHYGRSARRYTPRIAGLHVDCGSRDRIVAARGWPFLAVWCEYTLVPYEPSGQAHVVGGIMIDEMNPAGRPRTLPYLPEWPGFIINTLFYALLLWLLFFAPFVARRMLRRTRGQCEKCAYPIGVSPVCTECGAAVRRSTKIGHL